MNNFNQTMNFPQRNQFAPYFSPASGVSTSTNNLIWVQGIEGAKAWQLPPSSMTILLDSEAEGKMYIKVSDNIGMSTLRIFNYTEEVLQNATNNVTTNPEVDLSQFVKRDELNNLIKEIIDEQSIQSAPPAGTGASQQQPKVTILKK